MQKLWRHRHTRNIAMQALALGFVFVILGYAAYNAAINLEKSGITSGFGFLWEKAGYDISFSLLNYSPKTASHAYAWLVGVGNTVFFAILTITTTTLVSLFIAIMRLSPNWLLSALSRVYIEYVRNIPVLVHIFIWYAIVLALPAVRKSISLLDVFFISNRGIYMPGFPLHYSWQGSLALLCFMIAGVFVALRLVRSSKVKRFGAATGTVAGIYIVSAIVFGPALGLDMPIRRGFGFKGGMSLAPELLAMWGAVTVYFSAHGAEVIRGAIIAVPKGQAEAAYALGAKRRLVMMEVVIPQALRAIVPPMTSNYINILKAAALGTAIGFLDIMGTTGGSSLNITGQAVECIMIVMLTYMVLNLALSAIMGRVNKAVQIKER